MDVVDPFLIGMKILLHHSEIVDPTLVEWIVDRIDHVLGLEAGAMVLLLGLAIVLFPTGVLGVMWFQRRRAARGR